MTDEEKKPEEQAAPPKKKVDDEWKRQAQAEKQRIATDAKKAARQPLPPVSFGVFVNSLAAQALMALGDVENPITKRRERDLDHAKYTIDLLGMLDEKTKGNLTDQEKKLLDQVLYDLRMRYVGAAGL